MPRKKKNQREDKRFCVRLDLGIADGKRVRKSFYSYESLEDARAKRDEFMKTHSTQSRPSEHGITLSQWCEKWLKAYKSGLTPNGYDHYATACRQICKFPIGKQTLGDVPVAEIKQSHIQAYLSARGSMSKSTIHRDKVTLHQLFESALSDRIISHLPYQKISAPKGTYKGHRVIDQWERDAISSTWQLHRAGIWAMIMQYAGLRRGEMAALEWEDVDFENRTITINKSLDLNHKGSKKDTKSEAGERVVPLLKPLFLALQLIRTEESRGRICKSAANKTLTVNSYKKAWSGYMLVLERAANNIAPYENTHGWRRDISCETDGYKVVKIDAHDLRYTYASFLYDNDVDVKTAQYLMGHSSLDMTLKIYTKLSEHKKEQSIGKLVAFFDSKSDTQSDTQSDTH